jgi:predicted Zn-ribbon and HTH transcriptional regulator
MDRPHWSDNLASKTFTAINMCDRLLVVVKVFSIGRKTFFKEVLMSKKPSELEEEYVVRMEFERRKKLEEEKHKKLAQEEKKKLKELHNMRCPKCGMELIEIEYKKIKVDKCSECEGIWLDPGELYAVTKLEKTGLDRLFEVFRKQD